MTRLFCVLLSACLLLGCSTAFPTVPDAPPPSDGLGAQAIFDRSLAAHGGDLRQHPGDINLSTDGRWYQLIQRIQPVVTDSAFRIRSEERYRPSTGLYAVVHTGPGGSKHVLRTRDGLTVHYNGVRTTNDQTLRATAMTNDAFAMFHFGPSWFLGRTTALVRLPDAREGGRGYHRLLATLQPGFGRSAQDRAVLWIDGDNARLFRIHQTLEGFPTTRGAHVDTTFLDYRRVGPYLFPRALPRTRARPPAHQGPRLVRDPAGPGPRVERCGRERWRRVPRQGSGACGCVAVVQVADEQHRSVGESAGQPRHAFNLILLSS